MRNTLAAVAMSAAFGLAAGALADGHGNIPHEEQTSPEQVQMCDDNLATCASGADSWACVTALKTCVGDKRQEAMALMEEHG